MDGATAFNRLGLVVALATLGYLGYEGGRLWGARDAAQSLEEQLAGQVSARGKLTGIESEARADAQWLEAYLKASGQLDVAGLLVALRPALEAQGVVVRELEAAGDQLKLVLVSAGGEIRLPDLLEALRAIAGVQAVRLDQHKELGEATFVMDVPGFVRKAVAAIDREPGHGQQ